MNKLLLLVLVCIAQTSLAQKEVKTIFSVSTSMSVPTGQFAKTNKPGPGAAFGIYFSPVPQTSWNFAIGIEKFGERKEVPYANEQYFTSFLAGFGKPFPGSERLGYSINAGYLLASGVKDPEKNVITDKRGFSIGGGVGYLLSTKAPIELYGGFSWNKLTTKNYNTASIGISIPLYVICDCSTIE